MYPINFGSHRLKFGIYVTSISTTKIAAKYTSNCLNTVSICTLPTLTPTNSVVPTGGVIVPIHRLKIIMIPKWIVVIPSAVHTGRKIGVKIRQAGVISINVPTIRRIILIRNKITNLLLLTESSAVDTSSGIFVNAITHDMMLDTPIRKMMIPVISALSRRIFGSSLILIYLYTNNDRSRLYTTATTEPSVAVKIPKMIPPITITIRSRQGRA